MAYKPPGEEIHERRRECGLTQGELAKALEVTQPFVSQMERGLVELPSESVRAGLVRELGIDPFEEIADAQARRLTIAAASKLHGINQHALMRLVAEDKIHGHAQCGGQGYEIDAEQLKEDLAALPHCRFLGCERPATTPTGCCGEHAQKQWAIEARGTKRPRSVRLAIERTKRQNPRPRPDAKERCDELHAEADADAEAFERETGLYGRKRAAAYLCVTASALNGLTEDGVVEVACWRQFAIGLPRPFYAERELRRRRRAVALADDGAAANAWLTAVPLDPERAVKAARANGRLAALAQKLGSEDRAERLIRSDVEAKASNYRKHKAGRRLDKKLRDRLLGIALEVAGEAESAELNDVLGEIWFRDWQRNREAWSGYPAAASDPESPDRRWRKNGVERIRSLIGPDVEKLLQVPARKSA